ncbi:MAG TPA: ABC transporter permease [Vicinamibacterales bacterium]|nr:ABC transporter permease [Vicinamibacterales bacterium]
MFKWRRFLLRLRNTFESAVADAELTRELQAHLALLESEFLRRGMTSEEAHVAARRALGGVEQARELHRDARSFRWLTDMGQDGRYAIRTLSRARGFAATAVVTLGIGIGANTAIFSVVQSLLLTPLAYTDSDNLVQLVVWLPDQSSDAPIRVPGTMSIGEVTELRPRTKTLSHVGLHAPVLSTMSGRRETTHMQGTLVEPEVLEMLGEQPLAGRLFGAAEKTSGVDTVVIFSYRAWQQYFGGDPHIVGANVVIDGKGHTVVGVMPSGFTFPDRQTEFWKPLLLGPVTKQTAGARAPMMARLAEGVSIQVASAEANAILHAVGGDGRRYEFVRAQDELVAPVRPALLAFVAAAGFVLLIACSNVVNLLFARNAARRRELAIRVALGAGRGRIIRQLLTEGLMLAVLGGLAGVAVAVGGVRLLRTLATTLPRMDLGLSMPFPRLDEIGVWIQATAFAFCISIGAGLICSLTAAVRFSRSDRIDALAPFARNRLQRALVVIQIAVTVTLLAGGGLLIRSFVRLAAVDAGFDPSGVVTFQVALSPERYSDPQLRLTFSEELVLRLRSAPGVVASAYAGSLPLVEAGQEWGWFRTAPQLPDPPPGPWETELSPDARPVSRDYLQTLGIRLHAGRGFREQDRKDRPRVLLVNKALARVLSLGTDPIGQVVYAGPDSKPWEIVGVVEDVRQLNVTEAPEPQFFVDYRQWSYINPAAFPQYFAVRTRTDVGSAVANVRDTVRQLDSSATLYNVATMEQLTANQISRPRMYAVLAGIFAAVAAALAAIGIYGVIAYAVAQRTHEIGVRMALGARPTDVIRLAVGDSLIRTAIGIAIGLAAAAWLTRFLEGMLFGLTPLDLSTFAAVAAAFAALAGAASFLPARRAAQVDPLIALRCE